ncbi:NADH dehydrogenase [ubiquinone] 1 beta subcomplex subunit 4 [Mus musculus]|uniref:NADH dehydrogenase [ubiquinone] 1 beta subcomplex subunit 4 n=2 Tax=Mus TaxID=862507 RepID=NDUB4_MOUSE|nr:predicted pseudogene 3244 [Mus musculus]NP_080886.1 NADH dehydrogenase [ubiquinone] 1 beta subcomplex subunit 4 [Mus musculus]XP_001478493.1 NADH dehydrogenase [ubiquinone] 1 beta subcomplex subunit 4 [Mus musculus]XP_021040826.1 NADH dehydrogenase [ubiquinone] 1 beta subcomplex subunit 4 [Mus caroli]Q9CQC7.3 RecName: Full=NADH dehydrogenase [ubiquinone] 1 beta subcomplex subunit 4; AltName: Full=Complex I-B15; Short=CI-B15; AltName: Full=NADH-ubiquinone oxidoreductase B15 subunit [Mus muscu|eukprot:NP_080886.1 NADH dehydrogenase [ubiquinone] 1 beta subcomplex subunit 4 [Mus musculus]
MSGSKYKPAPLATLPSTLDPAEYDVSPETRRAQVERLSIRARLKREYLLQYNDPKRVSHIEDPALIRWTYARSANIYPNFRPTPKNSLLGAVAGFGPLIFWYYVFKTDRDRKERLIQEGKLDRKFNISY